MLGTTLGIANNGCHEMMWKNGHNHIGGWILLSKFRSAYFLRYNSCTVLHPGHGQYWNVMSRPAQYKRVETLVLCSVNMLQWQYDNVNVKPLASCHWKYATLGPHYVALGPCPWPSSSTLRASWRPLCLLALGGIFSSVPRPGVLLHYPYHTLSWDNNWWN